MKECIITSSFFCMMFIMHSCAFFNSSRESKTDNYITVASQRLGANLSYHYNTGKTYVLIYRQEKAAAENPMPFLHFLIYDLESDSLLLEDKLNAGSVKWKNDFQVEVNIIPGNISTENREKQYGYIFDVKSKKRIELINNNQQIINNYP